MTVNNEKSLFKNSILRIRINILFGKLNSEHYRGFYFLKTITKLRIVLNTCAYVT